MLLLNNKMSLKLKLFIEIKMFEIKEMSSENIDHGAVYCGMRLIEIFERLATENPEFVDGHRKIIFSGNRSANQITDFNIREKYRIQRVEFLPLLSNTFVICDPNIYNLSQKFREQMLTYLEMRNVNVVCFFAHVFSFSGNHLNKIVKNLPFLHSVFEEKVSSSRLIFEKQLVYLCGHHESFNDSWFTPIAKKCEEIFEIHGYTDYLIRKFYYFVSTDITDKFVVMSDFEISMLMSPKKTPLCDVISDIEHLMLTSTKHERNEFSFEQFEQYAFALVKPSVFYTTSWRMIKILFKTEMTREKDNYNRMLARKYFMQNVHSHIVG